MRGGSGLEGNHGTARTQVLTSMYHYRTECTSTFGVNLVLAELHTQTLRSIVSWHSCAWHRDLNAIGAA